MASSYALDADAIVNATDSESGEEESYDDADEDADGGGPNPPAVPLEPTVRVTHPPRRQTEKQGTVATGPFTRSQAKIRAEEETAAATPRRRRPRANLEREESTSDSDSDQSADYESSVDAFELPEDVPRGDRERSGRDGLSGDREHHRRSMSKSQSSGRPRESHRSFPSPSRGVKGKGSVEVTGRRHERTAEPLTSSVGRRLAAGDLDRRHGRVVEPLGSSVGRRSAAGDSGQAGLGNRTGGLLRGGGGAC